MKQKIPEATLAIPFLDATLHQQRLMNPLVFQSLLLPKEEDMDFSPGLKEGILLLRPAQVRPHLQSCIQLWVPQLRKDMEILEEAPR